MSARKMINHPQTLRKIAEDYIRTGIVNGRFQMGGSLSEATLCKEIGISKTPIREALSALNLQGLVQILPQRGAFVFTLSEKKIGDLCRYRTLLELAAIDLAYKNDPKKLTKKLKVIIDDMQQAQVDRSPELYLRLDNDFHFTLFELCGNSYLFESYNRISDVTHTIRTQLSRPKERVAKSFREHVSIYEHLIAGKLKSASTVLKQQITRGERVAAELLGEL